MNEQPLPDTQFKFVHQVDDKHVEHVELWEGAKAFGKGILE